MLGGVALLFWGMMIGQPVAGLVLAVLLEARQWFKLRWEFGEAGYVKAWYLTLLFVLIGGVSLWITEEGSRAGLHFLRWLPLMLLPIELAQRYGAEGRIALNSLFPVARQRMLKDIAEGRECPVFYIHTGYVYVGVVLAASSMSRSSGFNHQLGCALLLLWMVFGVGRFRKMRWQPLWLPMCLVILVGWMTQSSAKQLWRRGSHAGIGVNEPNGDLLTQLTTRIGTLGSIKNSKTVRWRLWTNHSPPPLLRLNSYNAYNRHGGVHGGVWKNVVVDPLYRSVDDSFETGIAVGGSRDLYVFDEEHVDAARSLSGLKQLHLRSTQLSQNGTSTLVLAPIGTVVLGDALGKSTLPESNTSGVIRLVNREAVLDYKLWVNTNESFLDGPVREGYDLEVPESEVGVLESIVEELGLRELSDAEKVAKLRVWFYTKFRYTDHLAPDGSRASSNGSTALAEFLTTKKAGHCEYFGTAATLLLRQAGVASRYCVGYAVSERSVLDETMFLMRGTHAHAWSAAYIDGRWIDVDLTPPGWDKTNSFEAWFTALKDSLQGLQEKIRLWRIEGASEGGIGLVIGFAGAAFVVIIGARLWFIRPRSPQRMRVPKEKRTPLHDLERSWKKVLGERPMGMTLPSWLRLSEQSLDVNRDDLEVAIGLHEGFRFSELSSELEEKQSRLDQLVSLVSQLKKAKKL